MKKQTFSLSKIHSIPWSCYGIKVIQEEENQTMIEPPNSTDGTSQWKTISPYDITTRDIVELLITQVQLKGENYDEWVCSVYTTLKARKKFGFLDRMLHKTCW